jgi:hypothetical protein
MGYKMGMLVEPTKRAILERKLHEWQNIRLLFSHIEKCSPMITRGHG